MTEQISNNHFIFIASDGKKNGYDVFLERINRNLWPIYSKTPFLTKINEKNKILFYIAGRGNKSQNFVGSAIIKKILTNKNDLISSNQELKSIIFNVEFESIKIFKESIYIKDHIHNLTFIDEKMKNNYGLYFQGGISKINDQSYNYIIEKSNS